MPANLHHQTAAWQAKAYHINPDAKKQGELRTRPPPVGGYVFGGCCCSSSAQKIHPMRQVMT